MRFIAILAALALCPAPVSASPSAREITCYSGAREIFHGKNDTRFDLFYRGNAVTFVDAADGRWKTFPSCSMVWEVKP